MNENITQIDLFRLQPLHHQPRVDFNLETIEELAQSIKSVGLIQPIVVCTDGENYRIIAGERRWRAAQLLSMEKIPCIIKDIDPNRRHEIALIENIQREELSPLEEARAIKYLMEQFGHTHDTLALKIGKKRSTISNLLRILQLPEDILEGLSKNQINLSHAKLILSQNDPKVRQKLWKKIISKKFSVQQAEEWVKKNQDISKNEGSLVNIAKLSPNVRHLCDQMKALLGTKVCIQGNEQKGKIEITYYSQSDLERIAEIFVTNNIK